MKKGLIPVTLGTVVTATGIALDSNQSKKFKCKRNDYTSLIGAALVGAGVAHIVLGGIDLMKY